MQEPWEPGSQPIFFMAANFDFGSKFLAGPAIHLHPNLLIQPNYDNGFTNINHFNRWLEMHNLSDCSTAK